MKSFQKIRVDSDNAGQTLSITLNAPKGNVLDGVMITEITRALRDSGEAPEVKAIVFKAAGEHFSFGASVAEHQKEQVAEMLSTFHLLFRTLIRISRPTIAIVRGQCLGGGLELAAFCNWIFANERARFSQPEINLSVFPPAASLILPFRIGQPAADDLVLTGRSLSAREAEKLGLVYACTENPETAAGEFIEKYILPKSAAALKWAAAAARYEMHRRFLDNIERVERLYLDELMATADANEGIAAFLEKRPPVWKNR